MTLASVDPLPVGRYWIEMSRTDSVLFAVWRVQAVEGGYIEEERIVDADPDDPDDFNLYVWRVLKPIHWYADRWSWPNIADADNMDIWRAPDRKAPVRARRVARWKLAETIFVGIGTLVVATLIIDRIGSKSSKDDDA
jgi:hypothetical protein